MYTHKKIKVLVVDDSLVFREVMSRGIATDPQIDVVAKAVDPFDARDKLLKFEPDVMICDVEMPKMNGIEFIKRLLPQYAVPVIVVSTLNEAVFDAINAGAIDFIAKPDAHSVKGVEGFIHELIAKIKIVVNAKIIHGKSTTADMPAQTVNHADTIKVIAIGASTGGTEAIFKILKQLPVNIPGIVIVQHIPPLFSKMFAERLNNQTQLKVKEAETGDWIKSGRVLIAPGDKHMKITKTGDQFRVEVFEGDKVNGHCPSVDVLFESAAKVCGSHVIGVILTGMGYDGAKGLLTMRRKGARTIGQNESSSVVYGMPKAAFEIGAVEKQASLVQIPHLLTAMIE